MGLFGNQFANVVEWEEYRDDILFWKWSNQEIKKGSRLIIRPGQDAIFLYNGKVEGIFTDEGSFDIESEIGNQESYQYSGTGTSCRYAGPGIWYFLLQDQ